MSKQPYTQYVEAQQWIDHLIAGDIAGFTIAQDMLTALRERDARIAVADERLEQLDAMYREACDEYQGLREEHAAAEQALAAMRGLLRDTRAYLADTQRGTTHFEGCHTMHTACDLMRRIDEVMT